MREAAELIWRQLRAAGMTEAGAAAMLGNMQAESALRADNAQDGMTSLSDAEYTRLTDMGAYPGFASDAVGYGLCQWTYPTRKAALLRFARAAGKSVGDAEMQLDFCVKELREDYCGLWNYLCSCGDIDAAAGRICREFERPAVDNSGQRAEFARRWYEELKGDADCHVADAPRNDKLSTAPESCHCEAGAHTGCGNPSSLGNADCHVADAPRNDKLSTAPESCHCEASAHTGCGNPSSSDFWPPRTIALNMEGPDVLLWQALMWARGYDCPTGGCFDEQTELVTREYQRAAGLASDGIPGPKTWREGLRL